MMKKKTDNKFMLIDLFQQGIRQLYCYHNKTEKPSNIDVDTKIVGLRGTLARHT